MPRILFESHRAGKRIVCALFVVALGLPAVHGCQSKVQNTSIDIGGGMRKGSPPMCFQYRSEVLATTRAHNVFLHVNNSCSYAVDCVFHDDVTEKDHRITQPAYQAFSYMLAEEVAASRVDIDVECTWKP